MTDHDDKLTRRYRELAREEPRAALDTAILAASRRATARPSASRRWAMPVSVAAVLVLTVGVTLRMQQDQPGIETAVPQSSQPLAPAAAPESVPTQSPSPPPSVKAKDKLSAARQDSRNQAPKKIQLPPARDSLLKEEAQAVRAESKPFADAPAKSAAPPLSDPAAAAAPRPATAPAAQGFATRMKREAAADSARALQSAPLAATEQERELERIARLRIEGRHAEADKALEEFRRKFPDFRIPEAMWERVRAR